MHTFKYFLEKFREVGFVEQVMPSLVHVTGLPKIMANEVVLFETGQLGQVVYLTPDWSEILVLSETQVEVGTRAARTGESLNLPLDESLLGKICDPLGRVMFPVSSHTGKKGQRLVDGEVAGIEERVSVNKPLETGVTMVDLLVPLGCGQRELVIGDRKTGKTSFLLQTICYQAKQGLFCIYAAIGKKKSEIKRIYAEFQKKGILDKVAIVYSSPDDPASIIWLTPFSALALAEHFKDQGKSVLLVLDDLSVHARICRQLALVGKHFPGRDSYPVDIFFTHARLLEKAGNFRKAEGGETSITALVACETNRGDLSGYIQTNLMSMTDGHIFFDANLFAAGRRPGINPFLSVTRVGRQTQTSLQREISRTLLAFLIGLEKMKNFIHFGAELTEEVKKTLAKGDRLTAFLDQNEETVIPADLQVFLFAHLWADFWSDKTPPEVKIMLGQARIFFEQDHAFQKEINKIVAGSQTLPELLKKTGKQSEFLVKKLEVLK